MKENFKKYKQEKANRKIWATLLSIRSALENFQKQRLERIKAEEGFLDPYSGFQKYLTARLQGHTCLASQPWQATATVQGITRLATALIQKLCPGCPGEYGYSYNALIFPRPVHF